MLYLNIFKPTATIVSDVVQNFKLEDEHFFKQTLAPPLSKKKLKINFFLYPTKGAELPLTNMM